MLEPLDFLIKAVSTWTLLPLLATLVAFSLCIDEVSKLESVVMDHAACMHTDELHQIVQRRQDEGSHTDGSLRALLTSHVLGAKQSRG